MSKEFKSNNFDGEKPHKKKLHDIPDLNKIDQKKIEIEFERIQNLERWREAVDEFSGNSEAKKFLVFLGHTASEMLKVASPEGVRERVRYDHTVSPIIAKVDEQDHIVGYIKSLPSDSTPENDVPDEHLIVTNNSQMAITEGTHPGYADLMKKQFVLSGVTLDDGKITAETTAKLFNFLEDEKGVQVKLTHQDPETYDIVQDTLGIDPVLRKHVEAANGVVMQVENFLGERSNYLYPKKEEQVVQYDFSQKKIRQRKSKPEA